MRARRCWAYETGALWAIDLDAALRAPVSPRCAATFREADRAMAAPLAAAMGLRDPEPVLEWLRPSRRCFVALTDGTIAAYGWVSLGSECVGELEREFRLANGEAYIWDCRTLPEWRGKRLYSALLGAMLVQLRDEGLRRVWIGASLNNKASIRGFVNAGFQPAIKLAYLRVFGLRLLWPVAYPSAPQSLVAAARRVIVRDDERPVGPLLVGWYRDKRLEIRD